MLVDDRCSIYDHRPQTCRAYDCRVFAATAIDNDEKPLIARQARRWRFSYATEADRAEHDRLRTTAAHPDERPGSPTERAWCGRSTGPADVADEPDATRDDPTVRRVRPDLTTPTSSGEAC